MVLNKIQLIIASAIILALLGFIGKQWIDKKNEVSSLRSINQMKADSISYLVGRNGEIVAERDAAYLRSKDLASIEGMVEELKFTNANLGKKLNSLESYTKSLAVSRQQITTNLKDSTIITRRTETSFDTLYAKKFDYIDEYTILKGLQYDTIVEVDISVKVPLKVAIIQKHWRLFGKARKWLPRKKEYTIEAASDNPNVAITEIEHYKVK